MTTRQTIERLQTAFPGLAASEFRGQTRVVVPAESLREVLKTLKEECGFDLLADITCVDYLHYRDAKDRFGLVYVLANTETSGRIVVRTLRERPGADRAVGRRAVGGGELVGAGGVGHVRHPLCRAPRPAADSAARGVHGPSAAEGLSLAGARRAAQFSGDYAGGRMSWK